MANIDREFTGIAAGEYRIKNETGGTVAVGKTLLIPGFAVGVVSPSAIADDATGVVRTQTGLRHLDKVVHDTTAAIKAGEFVYEQADGKATNVAATATAFNKFLGIATEDSASPSAIVLVQLLPLAFQPNRVITAAATGANTLPAHLWGPNNQVTFNKPNSAAVTVTIPDKGEVPDGSILRVRKTGTGGAHAITLATAGATTVGGGATLATIDANGDWALLQLQDTDWAIIDSEIA